MPGKKKRKRERTLRSRIVRLVSLTGQIALPDMTMIMDAPYQSVNTECLELQRLGVLKKDREGLWSLVTEESPTVTAPQTDTSTSTSQVFPSEEPLTNEEKFVKLLRSVGMKDVALTISEIFFTGDVGDMDWLYHVLLDMARGYVSRGQAKLIMAAWAVQWGVPYEYEDFFED